MERCAIIVCVQKGLLKKIKRNLYYCVNVENKNSTANRFTVEYFLQNLLPCPESNDGMVLIIIGGREEALDDLCIHWFLGHHLKERTSNQATFLLDKRAVHEYVPNFLLPYGKAIQVIEPQSLKKKLVSVVSELMEYYKL